MMTKKAETASFLIRFTQKVFQAESGESQVQWRGNIQHVQGGEEQRFSEFDEAVQFIQAKLADLTLDAMENKSPEEQKSILAKNFDLWKKMALSTPKLVMDTIKDPKKQIEQVQHQIQQINENVTHKIEETIKSRLEIDDWKVSSKSDYKNLVGLIEQLSQQVQRLSDKVEQLSDK